jgi:sugar O-acyltransferase (sialic acid O-acetyltransferase NeuD family)
MRRVILFGVGSGLIVDYEESCARAGIEIAAAVQNRPGACYIAKQRRMIVPAEIGGDLLDVPYLCPLFTPANRKIAAAEAEAAGLSPSEALVDPTAVVASTVELGKGTYINAAVTIGGCTRLGVQVILNRAASLGHHCSLGDFVSIGPGAVLAGEISIGRGSVVGAGSVILPTVKIGAYAIVAGGSVVSKDIEDGTMVAGSPARAIKRKAPDALA